MLSIGAEIEPGGAISADVAFDWAGCGRSRKSASGGVVIEGCMAVETWSTTQSTVAKSSGEADCHALARGAVEALGLAQPAMRDQGWELKGRVSATPA